MPRPKATRFELQLLEQLWKLGSASVREVQESLPEKDRPAYTTVQTTMYRLEAKKAVRLRSTNDGITATIDSAGRLRGTLPLYVEATSYTGFTYISGQTVYTRYGNWFVGLCAAMVVMGLLAERMLSASARSTHAPRDYV